MKQLSSDNETTFHHNINKPDSRRAQSVEGVFNIDYLNSMHTIQIQLLIQQVLVSVHKSMTIKPAMASNAHMLCLDSCLLDSC